MDYQYLNNINNVNDVKKLSFNEMSLLANEIRDLIIESTSNTGGHLASSLGVVELTIALLYSYDFDKDKIIWDVGHQSYAYKILTNRKNNMNTLRTYGGLSGFPKRNESKYDFFDTGHSSTSLSAGLGMCVARDLNNDKYKVVSIIGDGALTGGMALEALNNLSNLKSNFVIILNDNEMSISKSDGGINKALLGIRISPKYNKLKKLLKKCLEKNSFGLFIKNILIAIVNFLKQLVVSEGMFFENLNINYVGPIDGHNIKELCETIKTAKNSDEPVVIHIKTVKGKGYKYAEENPTKFHGISPFEIETGNTKSESNKISYTNVFSDEIVKLASEDEKIVTITAAMSEGTGLVNFSKKFPNRFFDVGICEQHAVTFAGGMAALSMIPIVCIYSTFLQRAFDQIIHDICMQNLHVVFMIDRAGLVGADGETHQGNFDISYLRLIPNMTILAPKNDIELRQMLKYAIYDINSPVAIRYPRGNAYLELAEYNEEIKYGKSQLIYEGDSQIAFFAIGTMVSTANNIIKKLKKKNINATLINARFAKPIDYYMLDKLSKNYKEIIVLEENVECGGIGQEILQYIYNKNKNVKVSLVNLPDSFIEQGNVDILRKDVGIDSDSIINKLFDLEGKNG